MTRRHPPQVVLLALLLAGSACLGLASPAHSDGAVRATDSTVQRAGDGRSFTIAVIPDTQREVHYDSDKRLPNRIQWLVRQKDDLDLRFVIQVGDLTDWGWVDPPQLARASAAFQQLQDAHIPYTIAVGNHDTRAVGWNGHGGYGGSAYVYNPECRQRFSATECRTGVLVRRTQEINASFTDTRFGDVQSEYESGKIDNKYSTFQAGGLDWLVLDLELWPRASAVAWADQVIDAHPTYNVIVNTHMYLNGQEKIPNDAGYGSTSPQYIWSHLRTHPNVVMVTSGHIGNAGLRVDRADDGHKVVSMLQNFSRVTDTNPVRLVTVDPSAGTLSTRVYAPLTDKRFGHLRETVRNVTLVRPSR